MKTKAFLEAADVKAIAAAAEAEAAARAEAAADPAFSLVADPFGTDELA